MFVGKRTGVCVLDTKQASLLLRSAAGAMVKAMKVVRVPRFGAAKLETVEEYKTRVNNAVRWLNANKKEEMVNLVASMPRRLAAVLKKKGAGGGY